MQIELTKEDLELLSEILQDRLAAVEREIHHTDHHEFKKMLKQRQRHLEHLMEKCGITTAV